MTETKIPAMWPAKPEVVACDPVAVASLMIKSGCDEMPYAGIDQSEGEKPSASDMRFWGKVYKEADRIASWAIQGLGITGRAIGKLGVQAEPQDVERMADSIVIALKKRGITLTDEAIAVISETAVQSLDLCDGQEWQIQEDLGPEGRQSWRDIPATDTNYQRCMTRFNALEKRKPAGRLRVALKRVTMLYPESPAEMLAG